MSDADLDRFMGRRVRRLDPGGGWRQHKDPTSVGTVFGWRRYNARCRGRAGGQLHVAWYAERCSWIAPDRVELIPDEETEE